MRVHTGQAMCKQSTSKLGHVYQCVGCESLAIQPLGKLSTHKQGAQQIKYCLPTGPPVDRECAHCGNGHHIGKHGIGWVIGAALTFLLLGGPIWIAPIHNHTFVTDLLQSLDEDKFQTFPRMVGMLSMVLEELQDIPLYYELARLCNITKQSQGKVTLYLSALLNAGYRVSLTHANKVGHILGLLRFTINHFIITSTGLKQMLLTLSSGP